VGDFFMIGRTEIYHCTITVRRLSLSEVVHKVPPLVLRRSGRLTAGKDIILLADRSRVTSWYLHRVSQ